MFFWRRRQEKTAPVLDILTAKKELTEHAVMLNNEIDRRAKQAIVEIDRATREFKRVARKERDYVAYKNSSRPEMER